jgi:nucleotide-binding universal stress UspA family protein
MTAKRIVIPLEITPISGEIIPVIQRLFPAEQVALTLVTVAQRMETPVVTDVYITGLPPAVYATRMVDDEEWEAYCQELKSKLHAVAQELRNAGYIVTTMLLTGEKVYELAQFVEEGNFDLLAMATYGRSGLSRLIYGSIAEQLLRLVSVPMLLLRHQHSQAEAAELATQTKTSPKNVMSIAVATDGSAHTQQAMQVAVALAQALHMPLQVLVTVRGRTGAAHGQEVMGSVQTQLKEIEPRPTLVPLVGPPDEVIGKHLQRHPVDLLILGAFQDRGAGGAADIGLTAQRVVQYAPRSVLMLKGWQTNLTRVLACIHFDDAMVMAQAIQISAALGAQLELLYVVPAPPSTIPHELAPDDLALDLAMAQEERLAPFLQDALIQLANRGQGRDALHIWQGDPLKTILHLAKTDHYDLLVIGSRTNARSFSGSLAENVVRLAPRSVLLVRPQLKKGDKEAGR